MKKTSLLVMPLMAISFLISCNNKENRKPLKECSWEEIRKVSESGKAKKWFNIGDEKTVMVNGQEHLVRIIGFDHDELASSSVDQPKYAGITFEFVNLISDSNGHSLATPWNWQNEISSTNYDYLNSNFRKAIDGDGEGEINWCQIGEDKISTVYTKSVLEMIASDPSNIELKAALKTVRKPIAIKENDDYEVDNTSYTTQLFPLSYKEMTDVKTPNRFMEGEGKTYEYYFDEETARSKRIKYQVNDEGAATKFTKINSTAKYWTPINFAGCGKNTEYIGAWLRSPFIDNSQCACRINYYGFLGGGYDEIWAHAFGVAPAFCI